MGIVKLPPEQEAALAELAKVTGRSEEELAHEAVADYLAVQQWHADAVRKGLAEAEAGLLVSDEDVKAWAESLGTDRRLPLPRARQAR